MGKFYRYKSLYILVLQFFALLFFLSFAYGTPVKRKYHPRLKDPEFRAQKVRQLRRKYRQKRQRAHRIAKEKGWPVRTYINGNLHVLVDIDEGGPRYISTCNKESAIVINADKVRQTPPYNIDGTGIAVGVWDGGAARDTHVELDGRVQLMESMSYNSHATHVTGTIAAEGDYFKAKGMAPNANILSYDFIDDIFEMTAEAMSDPCQTDTIQISNHSYGFSVGWVADANYSDTPGWHWLGNIDENESYYFGLYDSKSQDIDALCYDAQYYLPFFAAANERGDTTPAEGETFWYREYHIIHGWRWESKSYDSSTDPPPDDWDNGGFDTIPNGSTAKNPVVIGSINQAVTSGQRDLSTVSSSSFSSWGPVDDGRVKPDLVTCGENVYSCIATGDINYGYKLGTSTATPSATGAAALLIDYYDNLYPGEVMPASTIKGLLIHTADDVGNIGPDYKFGFGVINTLKAVQQIENSYRYANSDFIIEGLEENSGSSNIYTFRWNDTDPIKVTIVWTDPEGPSSNDLDDTTPVLINDLDIQLEDPMGNIYQPYVLDVYNPDLPATEGDNDIDNVEQIYVYNPMISGDYTVTVSHEGSLSDGYQYYSLFISGQKTIKGDFNDDKTVDLKDLKIFSDNWLGSDIRTDIAGNDENTNLSDFEIFSQNFPTP